MSRPFVRLACLALAALALGAAATEASAHGRVRYGVYVGAPIYTAPYWYGGYYRPYPYYAYPPTTLVVPAAPTTYIEQAPAVVAVPATPVMPAAPAAPAQAAQAATLPAGYWYYCQAANAYYPYVRECPAGWQQVAPQPPVTPAN